MISSRTSRRGLTLLELLVVVFILSILLAVSIPIFRVPMDKKAVREAARAVSTALGMARARALETGRPYGVRFERLGGTSKGSGRLSFVTVPPPYAGDYDASRLRILSITPFDNPDGDGELRATWSVAAGVFPMNSDAQLPSTPDNWRSFIPEDRIVRPGDTLKLNHQGHQYRVIAIDEVGNGEWTLDVGCKTITVWPYYYGDADASDGRKGGPEYSYQFFRQPVPTSASPVLLPDGAVVDIVGSGISSRGLFTQPTDTPVTVTFTPAGLVDRVWSENTRQGTPLFDSLYLLIGKPGQYQLGNLNDLDNLWVTINYQTGLISTSNMAVLYDEQGEPMKVNAGNKEHLHAVREYARSGNSIRG